MTDKQKLGIIKQYLAALDTAMKKDDPADVKMYNIGTFVIQVENIINSESTDA